MQGFFAARMARIVLTVVVASLIAGCGGGTDVAGLNPGLPPVSDGQTGGLILRITRTSLGLPPAGRTEGDAPLVTVNLTAAGGLTAGPYNASLTGDGVEVQVPGLMPAVWTISVVVTVGSVEFAHGQTTAEVRRGETTAVYIPLITAPPTPTAGEISLGVGMLVDVPNGTEIVAGSDRQWVIQAPAVYVAGATSLPGQETRLRIELFATNSGDTRSVDENVSVADYQSATGAEPELETSPGGDLLRAVRMKGGDTMTLRWSRVPNAREVVIRIQRGVLYEGMFQSSEEVLTYSYPVIQQDGSETGQFRTVVTLAGVGGIVPNQVGETFWLFYELTWNNQESSSGRVDFVDGVAVIEGSSMRVGAWRIHALLYGSGQGQLREGSATFTVVAGQTAPVDLRFTTGPSNGFTMDDVVSHDGDRLSRSGVHRFTWTPVGAAGATSCRLYLDLLHVSSSGGDGNYTPAAVEVTNFDPATMAVLTASSEVNGETVSRVTAINANPGTTVQFTVGLVPWAPLAAVDYNRLQLGRVDNIQPAGANYRVIGQLPITD